MTLTISIMRHDAATGQLTNEIPLAPGDELAGPESWRYSFYASEATVRLGLPLLYSLGTQDIVATGDEIHALKREAQVLLQDAVADNDSAQHRLSNIVRACELAASIGATVWIG